MDLERLKRLNKRRGKVQRKVGTPRADKIARALAAQPDEAEDMSDMVTMVGPYFKCSHPITAPTKRGDRWVCWECGESLGEVK